MSLYDYIEGFKSPLGGRIKRRIQRMSSLACLCFAFAGCGGGTGSGVPPRALISVSVQPASAEATAPTGTAPFTANGTFDQAPTTKENLTVQWASSDSATATIDASSGLATCVADGGPVTITAISGGKRGTAQLNCLAAPQAGAGNCEYQCGSVRCGALTGYCSISSGNSCRAVFAPGACPKGKAAAATATNSCGVGVDTSRTCSE